LKPRPRREKGDRDWIAHSPAKGGPYPRLELPSISAKTLLEDGAMRRSMNAFVVASSLLLETLCALALGTPKASAVVTSVDLPQTIITYGFLVGHYPDEFILGREPRTPLASDMKALNDALNSLDCDVPIRLGFPHRVFVVPSLPVGQWIGFVRTADTPPDEGTLFVTEPLRTKPERVLVVLSSVSPERTTVFWVERSVQGYASGLVYDSFKKGKISNENHTAMGAVTAVSAGEGEEILLKEWAEPGSRPRQMGSVGRVFRVDAARHEITLEIPGTFPQP
jgi:hypothetical protein